MLRAGHDTGDDASPSHPPPSPIRRLVEPVPVVVHDEDEADTSLPPSEFVSSTPAPQSGGRIKREAFSPNYFSTFFIEERELGRGGKGVVLLVRHEIDGCNLGHFACKRVPVGDDHAWLEKVLIEVELLANLAHPNLVSYRHVWLENVQLTRFGPSVACAFILQQYCNGGDLLQYIIGDMPREATKEELKAQMRRRSRGQAERPQVQKRLPPEEIYSLFKDVTSGLAYLHAANYIHRDLKPSNCLLHRDGNLLKCLISDFGEVQAENAVRKSTGSTGTISYCAPEVLSRDASGSFGNFTTKSDIFSLGMILYFMCFGRLPYINANSVHEELEDIDQLRAEISDWKGFQDERRVRPDLPPKLYQLLKKLLSVNPAERPTASEVLGAMGADSSLDSMMRGSRNTSPLLGISGQRIQNLDSPLPPGTPIPGLSRSPPPSPGPPAHPAKPTDPTKHARVNSTTDADLPNPFNRPTPTSPAPPPSPKPSPTNTAGLLTTTSKRLPSPLTATPAGHHLPTSHAMTLSRSNRSSRSHHTAAAAGRTPSRSPQRSANPTVTTPLLMPPPTTRLEQARHAATLLRYRAAGWVAANAAVLRLVLFAAKMVSLSGGCWPWGVGWWVGALVVGMAVGDLPLYVRLHGNWDGDGEGRWWLGGGGWRRSAVLLGLHFVVLGVAARVGVLCAAAEGRVGWEGW